MCHSAEACREKRARNNVYSTKRRAFERLYQMRRHHGRDITTQVYRCPFCRLWHLGKPATFDRVRSGQ